MRRGETANRRAGMQMGAWQSSTSAIRLATIASAGAGCDSAGMPELTIRIRKKADGSAAIDCLRADGSTTWQRQEGVLGAFLPEHDITHFVVETVLGYRRGFYGLIADGWNVTDFAKPWPRGPIPAEAREVEFVVGLLQTERRMGGNWSAAELEDHAAKYASATGQDVTTPIRTPSDAELDTLRRVRAEWLERWRQTKAGDALVMEFDRAPAAHRSC
jgi:hypothetical protein